MQTPSEWHFSVWPSPFHRPEEVKIFLRIHFQHSNQNYFYFSNIFSARARVQGAHKGGIKLLGTFSTCEFRWNFDTKMIVEDNAVVLIPMKYEPMPYSVLGLAFSDGNFLFILRCLFTWKMSGKKRTQPIHFHFKMSRQRAT